MCDLYFYNHFPEAIATALELQGNGGPIQFAYTTHPFLVAEYLDGAANCSHFQRTQLEIDLMIEAIENDIIRWHGKPMNIYPELTDNAFFQDALSIMQSLNARFNKTWGQTVAKSTDVTGLSKSVIPILANANIKALHMGYNWACHTANVPPVFVWKHNQTGSSVIAMVEDSYGSFVYHPALKQGMAFLYTMDNQNPPDVETITAYWHSLQAQFPNSNLIMSSLDAFAQQLMTVEDQLPVYTGEIGDTWYVWLSLSQSISLGHSFVSLSLCLHV